MLVMPKNTKLIIFDLDGTLVTKNTLDLKPHVADWFAAWKVDGRVPYVAIATNQGGVGYHLHLLEAGKDTGEYPNQAEAEARVNAVAGMLGIDPGLVYMSFAFRFNYGEWVRTPMHEVDNPRWSRFWRKPNPGMLQAALIDCQLLPNQALMVGDEESDKQAAIQAGIPFAWASHFFQLPIPMRLL